MPKPVSIGFKMLSEIFLANLSINKNKIIKKTDSAFDFTSNFFHTEQYALINASKALPQQKPHISIENLDFQTASKKGHSPPG